MTKEEKDLLIKDLCTRLPYGVKLETLEGPQELDLRWLSINMCNIASPYLPYLLPISSMTEEQKNEWQSLMIQDDYGILYHTIKSYDYLNKHHFDYRGLIPMGLAINATGLNIY